jgi:hypothetical protein
MNEILYGFTDAVVAPLEEALGGQGMDTSPCVDLPVVGSSPGSESSDMVSIALASVLERGKEYEYVKTVHDPLYTDMIIACDIVRDFVIEHGLILYGGTAIDYALRLRGDKIYPDDMLKVPDLDFYSACNVKHAYMLADLLFARGYTSARAINALHMETMKVDLANNHWVADISYRPADVLERIPFIVYNGARIVHPHFQRIDQHSSLSYPYDDAPREVIFARWEKDIKRFNKLAEHYPTSPHGDAATANTLPTRRQSVVMSAIHQHVLTGFIAYAALYNEYSRAMHAAGETIPACVCPASFTVEPGPTGLVTFDTLDGAFEIMHFAPMKAAKRLGLQGVLQYEPYINLIPARIEGELTSQGPAGSTARTVIYSNANKMISVGSIRGADYVVRLVNVQALLKYFLSMYFVHGGRCGGDDGDSNDGATPKRAATYMARYNSLLSMINNHPRESSVGPLLNLSITTYGYTNTSLSRMVALNRLHHDIAGEELYKIPYNYYPAKGKGHSPFEPEDVVFFRESGRLIRTTPAAQITDNEDEQE